MYCNGFRRGAVPIHFITVFLVACVCVCFILCRVVKKKNTTTTFRNIPKSRDSIKNVIFLPSHALSNLLHFSSAVWAARLPAIGRQDRIPHRKKG